MYRVETTEFEGPFDLLLFFIKRDELDIYDIPISKITKDFLDYLQYLKELDLEIAGEFIVMASELMEIKVKMLLPPPEGIEEEEFDPRANLVKRLLEYKRFKEVSIEMEAKHIEQKKLFERKNFSNDPKFQANLAEEEFLKNITLFDLISAFQFTLRKMPRKRVHNITKFNVTLEEQIEFVLSILKQKGHVTFFSLMKGMTEKLRVVVTFLALLELVKNKVIGISQRGPYNDITIIKLSSK